MKLFYQLGYKYFRMPWDMGPREELVQLVDSKRITPCRAIDLGCGTGSNAVFLAQHGFDVTGVDYASSAIEKAKRKATTAKVEVEFVVDDLTNLREINGTFDFLVDYGALDDLTPNNRDRYVKNVLLLTHPGSRFLLWCFEWPLRWWERLVRSVSIGAMSLEPGEADKRFSEHFLIERIAGNTEPDYKSWPPGFAAYLMTRK
jgi:cyclopropane fatty-acyl-phospholipid synthase-like methyltransferase